MTAGKNIIPQSHTITKKDRNNLTGNKSFVIWLTGLSGSGKSTIANYLEQRLFRHNILTYILDGDNIRLGLNNDLGFEEKDRKENIRRVGEVSKLMADSGIIVLSALISPFKKDRNSVRNLFGENEFIEIFVRCPLEVCRQRDVKGLYNKVSKGELENFTGIDSIYEEPEEPEIIVDTDKSTVEECVDKIYDFIKDKLRI